jgi:hypothetical protein
MTGPFFEISLYLHNAKSHNRINDLRVFALTIIRVRAIVSFFTGESPLIA